MAASVQDDDPLDAPNYALFNLLLETGDGEGGGRKRIRSKTLLRAKAKVGSLLLFCGCWVLVLVLGVGVGAGCWVGCDELDVGSCCRWSIVNMARCAPPRLLGQVAARRMCPHLHAAPQHPFLESNKVLTPPFFLSLPTRTSFPAAWLRGSRCAPPQGTFQAAPAAAV